MTAAATPGYHHPSVQSNRWTSYDPRPSLPTSSTLPSQTHPSPSWGEPPQQRPHTTVGLPLPPPGAGPNHPPFAHHAQSDPVVAGLAPGYAGSSAAHYPRFSSSTPASGSRPLPSPSYPPLHPPPPRHRTSDSINGLPGYFGGPGDVPEQAKNPNWTSRPDSSPGFGSQAPPSQWNSSVTGFAAPPPLPRKDFSQEASSSNLFSPPPPLPPKIQLYDSSNPFNDEHQNNSPVQQLEVSPQQQVELPPAISSEPGENAEVDEEMERVLRMSMETFAVESQRPQVDEDDEARVMRESAEMYAKQQEMDRMGTSDDGEDVMARIFEMSLADAVRQQKQIEMEIKRSSHAPSTWGEFQDENAAGPSRPPAPLDFTAGTLGSVTPVRVSPSRPRIITPSASSANPSRATTPHPSNEHQFPHPAPEQTHHLSPSSDGWGDMPLPTYEEVLSPPMGPPTHHSPIPSSPSMTTSIGTPALSPMSASESLSTGRSASTSFSSTMMASPIEVSPQASFQPSPRASPSHDLPGDRPRQRLRPHSNSFQVSHSRTSSSTSLGRSPSSPITGGLTRQSFDRRQHADETGSIGSARSSSQPSLARPHTMYSNGSDMPPVPPLPTMTMPQPSFPAGFPSTSALSLPPSSDPAAGGKRIVLENEYVDGVCKSPSTVATS